MSMIWSGAEQAKDQHNASIALQAEDLPASRNIRINTAHADVVT